MKYKCPYCGKLFIKKCIPHYCNTGFRKNFHGKEWIAESSIQKDIKGIEYRDITA